MSEVKVFAMNDCDWMAGEDIASVTELYLKEYSGDLPADEALDESHELTEDQMDRARFYEDHGDGGDGSYQTFRQRLDFMIKRGDKFPCLFASSEY